MGAKANHQDCKAPVTIRESCSCRIYLMGIYDSHNDLDEQAAKFLGQYPTCGAYISGLLAKYKKALKEDLVGIGKSPEEVIENFENDLRKHCLRATD